MLRLLLTNDDGIDAPGLQALYESVHFAATLAGKELEVAVVAPDRGRSECSHSVETGETLQLKSVRPGWTSLNGTPVDCVRAGVLSMGFQADMVLSGVNSGANLGVNLMVSGTFAAARESSLLGIPAMAVSQYRRPAMPRSWEHVPHWLAETISDFWNAAEPQTASPHALLWNVNLPAIHDDKGRVPDRADCKVDRRPLERVPQRRDDGDDGIVTYECDYHGRPREADRDVAECFAGRITISRLTPFLEVG
ncbi:MAG: 5'/3'-nucleotidase SurE [Planctomycetota bacterium]